MPGPLINLDHEYKVQIKILYASGHSMYGSEHPQPGNRYTLTGTKTRKRQ
jgi:hypothetical protein